MITNEQKTQKKSTSSRPIWRAKQITFNLGDREVEALDEILASMRKDSPRSTRTDAINTAIVAYRDFITA